jgi:two-component system, OmpR family, sensor kinase
VTYLTVPAVSGGGSYRVRASIDPSSPDVLIIATSLAGVTGTLHRLFLIELFVTLGVLAGIVALGFWIVRLGLRPLAAIGKTADLITDGDLSRRVERAEPRTEVGKLGLALNTMLDRIEESDSRLRRFVADASHELRTPLAAVRAYAELFGRGADKRPEDLARAMAGIGRESERMSARVDDLRLLARLDEGVPLAREPVALEELASEAVETARTVDPSRRLEFDAESLVVVGDRVRLRQVIDNLLGNVRSHTPAGTPARVSLHRSDGSAVIEVSDEGPGMSATELERVFERFYRTASHRSRANGGAGLGLSIVAAITEAHHGTVSVSSEPGQGATFRVSVPLAAAGDRTS